MSVKVLIVVNAEWYFWSHRLALAKALQSLGFEVIVAAAVERGYQSAIEQEGFRFVTLHLQRRSTVPWQEVGTLKDLFRLYSRERPDIVHHVTIKPVIYGSLAAKAAGVPAIINAITGLGYTFLEQGFGGGVIRTAISGIYKLALSGQRVRVIFQNSDDQTEFISRGIVPYERTVLIRSSGVDHRIFSPESRPAGTPLIVLASRLLWDKGLGELVEAARLLKRRGIEGRVVIVGIPDDENPKSVPVSVLEKWQSESLVEWWGLRNDMPDVLRMASIAVLPSYREGVPRFLLEAAATGLPIVTTDVPGCREVVRHGENGFMVPPRNTEALAQALETLLCDSVLRERMGARSREIAIAEFSEDRVIRETMVVYRDLLGNKWPKAQSL